MSQAIVSDEVQQAPQNVLDDVTHMLLLLCLDMLRSLYYADFSLPFLLFAAKVVDTQALIPSSANQPNSLAFGTSLPRRQYQGASHNLEDGDSTEDESSQAADGAVLGRTGSGDAGSRRGIGGGRAGATGGAGRVRHGRVSRRPGGGARRGLSRGGAALRARGRSRGGAGSR